jgi:hypothetical protein
MFCFALCDALSMFVAPQAYHETKKILKTNLEKMVDDQRSIYQTVGQATIDLSI